jgi:hypothetical protein
MFRIGNDIDPRVFDHLLELMKTRRIHVNRYRSKSGVGRSQCFGIVRQRNGSYSGSRLNFERMDVYKELQAIAQKILPLDFQYTSCQVNDNYITNPHKDTGNRGESAIIGFGDYQNGNLMIEEVPVNIKYRLVYFDGSLYTHSTAPYTGHRYSLVFHRPIPIFLEIPKYQIIVGSDEKLYLEEDFLDVKKRYDKDGNCTYSSDSHYPKRTPRKHSLRECIVLKENKVHTIIDETASEASEHDQAGH